MGVKEMPGTWIHLIYQIEIFKMMLISCSFAVANYKLIQMGWRE